MSARGGGPGGGPRNVPGLLEELHRERHTGTVVLSGSPGGSVHLREGLIVAVETPGAPSAESILLKSGRVDAAGWRSACAAGGTHDGGLEAELGARGLLTPQEFRIACTAALFDAALALALTPPGGWEVTEAAPCPVTGPSFTPRRVTDETSRRLTLLAEVWGPPAEFARSRVLPAADVPARVPPRYATLLRVVNGRRTPRDIAFALGRGTYAVMLDLARMDRLGLLLRAQAATGERPSTAPRRPEHEPGAAPSPTASLPRRTPGTHHPHRTVPE
ncbi:hypothetical protein [Streptomyces zingiberis]|uniref:DUF4388 domain-containing protein n=1 Tax=Streptomyces zingiberis TaxID=2053010 RepID=A0ABX1BTL8_9ACTN|nr:hypothetical protein [Streptomyces zingiberis]NJQ01041.1 hypothetical protein [Streptomyces zingiberis]